MDAFVPSAIFALFLPFFCPRGSRPVLVEPSPRSGNRLGVGDFVGHANSSGIASMTVASGVGLAPRAPQRSILVAAASSLHVSFFE